MGGKPANLVVGFVLGACGGAASGAFLAFFLNPAFGDTQLRCICGAAVGALLGACYGGLTGWRSSSSSN